ncbi:hypothetical protein CsSME_00033838 [Camellia sinensis var. sinensis]
MKLKCVHSHHLPLLLVPLPPPSPLSNPSPARERPQLPPPPPLPVKVDPPSVTLDNLFRQPQAIPRIYYLPLSDEQVAAKLKSPEKGIKQSAGDVTCREELFQAPMVRRSRFKFGDGFWFFFFFSSPRALRVETEFHFGLEMHPPRRYFPLCEWIGTQQWSLFSSFPRGPTLLELALFFYKKKKKKKKKKKSNKTKPRSESISLSNDLYNHSSPQ